MAIDFFVTGSLLDRFLTKINDLYAPKSHTHSYAVINVLVAANAWVADATYPDYPYRSNVALTGVKATMVADVVFAPQDAQSGVYASVCNTYDGGVQIWARSAQAVTIKTIKIKE